MGHSGLLVGSQISTKPWCPWAICGKKDSATGSEAGLGFCSSLFEQFIQTIVFFFLGNNQLFESILKQTVVLTSGSLPQGYTGLHFATAMFNSLLNWHLVRDTQLPIMVQRPHVNVGLLCSLHRSKRLDLGCCPVWMHCKNQVWWLASNLNIWEAEAGRSKDQALSCTVSLRPQLNNSTNKKGRVASW